ncbi:MAG: DUF4190 domain-containing protein [Candidatus Dormibacteria bacterium]|jgi:hypothetical protein
MPGSDLPPGVDPSDGPDRPVRPPVTGSAGAPAPSPPPPSLRPPDSWGPPDAYAPPTAYAGEYPYAVPEAGNAPAVAALVLGMVGIVFCWFLVVNFILAALAIAFGGVGISVAGARGGAGRGMATAGLVLGFITAVAGILFVVALYSIILGTCANGAC